MMRAGNLIAVTALAAPSASTVVITGFAFPASVTVLVGGTLSWVNNDAETHTVTFTGPAFPTPTSLRVGPGKTGTVTFATAGTYQYSCEIHPSMKGRVEVVDVTNNDPYGYG